jgi:hypothetical protein
MQKHKSKSPIPTRKQLDVSRERAQFAQTPNIGKTRRAVDGSQGRS